MCTPHDTKQLVVHSDDNSTLIVTVAFSDKFSLLARLNAARPYLYGSFAAVFTIVFAVVFCRRRLTSAMADDGGVAGGK